MPAPSPSTLSNDGLQSFSIGKCRRTRSRIVRDSTSPSAYSSQNGTMVPATCSRSRRRVACLTTRLCRGWRRSFPSSSVVTRQASRRIWPSWQTSETDAASGPPPAWAIRSFRSTSDSSTRQFSLRLSEWPRPASSKRANNSRLQCPTWSVKFVSSSPCRSRSDVTNSQRMVVSPANGTRAESVSVVSAGRNGHFSTASRPGADTSTARTIPRRRQTLRCSWLTNV